jgi:DNA (cytosine-5)-methyltransferase 1
MKILNLYAGIGGNRKLWGSEHQITAIENSKEIANVYKTSFPKDEIIVTDAHKYLLRHFEEYDFIWASPPCPTHSRIRSMAVKNGDYDAKYADMRLYQEIILLDNFFKGKYVIENVVGYYEPLIKPQQLGRHYFWANFIIPQINLPKLFSIIDSPIEKKEEVLGFKLPKSMKERKDKILRNCVDPKLGLHVFKSAFMNKQEKLFGEEK